MRVSEQKKNEFWDYFTSEECKNFRYRGMTDNRLKRVKSIVWKDDDFWFDIVLRHGGQIRTPQEMREKDSFVFDHCIGNFFGQISEIMYRAGIIK